jgi:hypothetical protein
VQLFDSLRIEAQIFLAADENDWETAAEVKDFRDPLSSICQSLAFANCGVKRQTFSWTLSKESGESIAKQMRMTCESG